MGFPERRGDEGMNYRDRKQRIALFWLFPGVLVQQASRPKEPLFHLTSRALVLTPARQGRGAQCKADIDRRTEP